MSALAVSGERDLIDGGGHICLAVDDDASYGAFARTFLAAGAARGEKTVAFGPQGSPLQEALRSSATMTADPYVDVLQRRGLEPDSMFSMFRAQAAAARDEGYERLRVAADMDWLLATGCTPEDAFHFELMLDQVVAEVDATVLCAYRPQTFDSATIDAMACAHPVIGGSLTPPQFQLVADGGGGWALTGAVDLASAPMLARLLAATAGEPWVVDVSALSYLDVAAMRTIAVVASDAARTLDLRGASPELRRYWQAAGFDTTLGVRLVG